MIEISDTLRTIYLIGESKRFYHTLDHAIDVAVWCDRFCSEMGVLERDRKMLIHAALWHDAIYVPGAKDNELLSAKMAAEQFLGERIDEHQVFNLVMATTHEQPGDGMLEQALQDADLAGIGASPRQFWRNEVLIRGEFAHVPWEAYGPAHGKLLASFADRPTGVYQTEFFRERLEKQALDNIRAAWLRCRLPVEPPVPSPT